MNALVPPACQWPRGPLNKLHEAACVGSVELMGALLAEGSIDVNQGCPFGDTPLMIAADQGPPSMTKLLLSKSADASPANDEGCTALHFAARKGRLAATRMLMKAGAKLESRTGQGLTPLHTAAAGGHAIVMRELIEAGARVDNRMLNEQTPLYVAASGGHTDAVKELLRAKANPLLGPMLAPDETSTPLDSAAHGGHLEVLRELITWFRIAGRGGSNDVVRAVHVAVSKDRVDVMAVLFDGGLVDAGEVLLGSTLSGSAACLKFLLQQQDHGNLAAYVNVFDHVGRTPLLCSVASGLCPPSFVRLLLDAGADTTVAARFWMPREGGVFHGTPLAFAARSLRTKKVGGTSATEKQLHELEGIRRLLLQAEAVHAVSWLWASGSRCNANRTRRRCGTATLSTQLRTMVPTMRRSAQARRVVLTTAFRLFLLRRYSTKP
ncbi:unnamed protein product [Scytosiphon promiscuus]